MLKKLNTACCSECGKKEVDGWALYCVECMEKTSVDPVEYTIKVSHWNDGDVNVQITGAGDSDKDREAIAYAIQQALHIVKHGEVKVTQ
jgi:ribosomal protein S9